VTFVEGKVGQAFSFDGVNDYVQVPDDNGSLSFEPTAPITVELWAYQLQASLPIHFAGKRTTCGGDDMNYQMATDARGLLFGSLHGTVTTGEQLPLNTWTHLAATFDGTTFRFYINGMLKGTATGTLGPTNTAPFEIGTSGSCFTRGFPGLIDEVGMYNRALSQAEIQAIVDADSRGKCKP